jgi:hypothetical protein
MRYARRVIAILMTVAIWGIAPISNAFALRPDPPGAVAQHSGAAATTLPWGFVMVALTGLLVFAVAGLIASLRRTRTESRRSQMLRA